MGNKSSRSNFKNAIIYLSISADRIKAHDEKFWSQIWFEDASNAAEIIKSISNREIRILRDGSPVNFATLAYKMVEKLYTSTSTLCNTHTQQTAVINASRMLVRIIPCIFEDPLWRNFFIDNHIQVASADDKAQQEPVLVYPEKSIDNRNYSSYLPPGVNIDPQDAEEECEKILQNHESLREGTIISIDPCSLDKQTTADAQNHSRGSNSSTKREPTRSLLDCLIASISDLLFCPEFTVLPDIESYSNVDVPPEDLKSLTTFDYVWEPGVGFESDANSTTHFDKSRSVLLSLLLTCFSGPLYEMPQSTLRNRNQWIEAFVSGRNRHALPLFTSILNVVFIYRPSRFLQFNRILFEDAREELVEFAIQILIVVLDYQFQAPDSSISTDPSSGDHDKRNLFIEYLSRIHREEDFIFIVKGFISLLNAPLSQGYLLSSRGAMNFDQELLILFWKICTLNNGFMNFVLNNRHALEIVVPILYHMNENLTNPSKSALIHIGVFNLLILSGERNLGVILNTPYTSNLLTNLPQFNGTHADLLIVVIHKLVLYGENLHQLFDYLLTVVVNISPYIKSMTLLASKCLMQIFEIFSSPFIILTEPNYHQIVIFMLEVFNNLIQYQFDGNTNMVFMILAKREVFMNLESLPETEEEIKKVLSKLMRRKRRMDELRKHQLSSDSGEQNFDSESQDMAFSREPRKSTEAKMDGATLSSASVQQVESSCGQSVSLIATPGIDHVTQTVHPSDTSGSQFFFGPSPNEDISTSPNDTNLIGQAAASEGADVAHPQEATREGEPPSLIDGDDVMMEPNVATCTSPAEPTRGWRPTPEWLVRWKKSLPMQTCLRMIEVLAPKLDQFERASKGQSCNEDLMKFLKNGTLVGLLPVPHPISIRKYHTNEQTSLWFRTCTWGIIYVRNTIWTDTRVKLIKLL